MNRFSFTYKYTTVASGEGRRAPALVHRTATFVIAN